MGKDDDSGVDRALFMWAEVIAVCIRNHRERFQCLFYFFLTDTADFFFM